MKHVKPWRACATVILSLVALTPAASSAEPTDDYANQTPYGQPEASVKTPPQGYTMFFLETVGRHGARSLTNDSTEKDVLDVWERADDADALTELGQTLARDVERFQAAEEKIGYGKLSGLGRDEWQGIGKRHAESYGSFLADVKRDGDTIDTSTTEVTRTKQSAGALHDGLVEGGLDLDQVLTPLSEAESLLRIGNKASPAGKAMTEEILERDAIGDYATDLLRGLYTPEYVDTIEDPVDAALDVYTLYSTAPGMAEETDITFARYVPQDTREPLSYATDVETFYQYGPGVEGETNTVDNARPLLSDFFARLDDRIAGSSTAAVFRLAHGETTMPFAALIKAPGSQEQEPEGERFVRQSNPWRGAEAGRLAGNIEWSAFRNDGGPGGGAGPRAAESIVLVTMRSNEKPVPFHEGCSPYTAGSYFYTVTELKSCLG